MELSAIGAVWCTLFIALFIGSFGLRSVFYIICLCLLLLAGLVMILYQCAGKKSSKWLTLSTLDQQKPLPAHNGLKKLLLEVLKGRPKLKIDKRMTGSSVIDDVLQELLIYTYRDYIHQWYSKISDDEQFQYDIRQTLQRVVIAFSERAKDVDLVPYLTRRLVDDFASHIRLYRRTLKKMQDDKNDSTKPPPNMESIFFDLELEMENSITRDQICVKEESERRESSRNTKPMTDKDGHRPDKYLQELSEVLMFLLLPAGDFHNKLFRYITREVLVNGILLPTINLVSDPDFINQTISWLCKESMLTSESLLTILRTSDSTEELQAMREKIDADIARQRSKDSGGDDDTLIKQQLSSLMFVKSVCDQRIQQLKDGVVDTDIILPGGVDVSKLLGTDHQLYALSFDVILNNAVALAYFIEYMTGIGAQNYLFFYLTVEGYRVSAEQQMSAALLSNSSLHASDVDTLREAATGIYNQYLSDKATPKLKLDDQSIKSVLERIDSGQNLDTVFDSIQAKVSTMLQQESKYFPAFKKSSLYIKLLVELDLLNPENKAEDALSLDEDSQSQTGSIKEDSPTEDCDSVSSAEGTVVAASSNSYTLSAQISNTGICREHGKAYTVYLISVVKKLADGTERTWDIYRRYNDFYDLHMILQNKFNSLSGLILPKKRAFDNMNKEFLEKRKIGLNSYLQSVLSQSVLTAHKGLLETVYEFLENMHWEREKTDLERKMDTIVNPLRSSVRNVTNMVRSMPDNLVDGVVKVSGGFRNIPGSMIDGVGRMLSVKGHQWTYAHSTAGITPGAVKTNGLESGKVSASLDVESDEDSIPLHIMLLLMDEVFDLKTRNQWLRRRIVAILQQIAKTMFGDSINRRIVENVAYLTSPEQIAEYIRSFRDSHWPNGSRAEVQPERDESTKMRCRVVCKAKLYGHFSEELQHLIGSETTRQGVMLVFSMFQHQKFNRRLVYVVLEGLLETIFPDNKFDETFRKIHSTSPRVDALKKSKKSTMNT